MSKAAQVIAKSQPVCTACSMLLLAVSNDAYCSTSGSSRPCEHLLTPYLLLLVHLLRSLTGVSWQQSQSHVLVPVL